MDTREVHDPYRDRPFGTGRGGAVAELAGAVVAPGLDRAFVKERQGMAGGTVRGDSPDVREVGDPNRFGLIRARKGAAVAELSLTLGVP